MKGGSSGVVAERWGIDGRNGRSRNTQSFYADTRGETSDMEHSWFHLTGGMLQDKGTAGPCVANAGRLEALTLIRKGPSRARSDINLHVRPMFVHVQALLILKRTTFGITRKIHGNRPK